MLYIKTDFESKNVFPRLAREKKSIFSIVRLVYLLV